eukprot:TRINITY_DN3529_c0_g1_i1.p1 TRINITY_DN3529_c0_g1~~TRINITY_DN3529_c0_g1_i1.p1  ORF type:complete len:225 (+),score=33.08 TRINITY_DN3529_c0_g1_i1:277-951(+)
MGNLLMLNGDFDAAINAYKRALAIEETGSAYYQIAKCLILLENSPAAIKALQSAVQLNFLPTYTNDLNSLKIFQGTISFEKAEAHFTQMLGEGDAEIMQEMEFKGEGSADYCRSDMESMHRFPIFEVEDWTAYRAVMRMYLGKYSDALKDFEILFEILMCKKMKYSESQEGQEDTMSELEREINLLRFSPVTINECRYNIMLCHLLVRWRVMYRVENMIRCWCC